MRRWSNDLLAMSKRIDAVVRAADIDVEAKGVTLVGYSQGAERAEWLAARFPEKYSRLILIASPMVPSPERLGRARAVVLLAGSLDWGSRQNMLEGQRKLARAGVPVRYFDLPNAAHGAMGDDPEGVMAQALDFVEKAAPLKEN
jgi:pimeloyl-ACP methyl ester carboxylesterase